MEGRPPSPSTHEGQVIYNRPTDYMCEHMTFVPGLRVNDPRARAQLVISEDKGESAKYKISASNRDLSLENASTVKRACLIVFTLTRHIIFKVFLDLDAVSCFWLGTFFVRSGGGGDVSSGFAYKLMISVTILTSSSGGGLDVENEASCLGTSDPRVC